MSKKGKIVVYPMNYTVHSRIDCGGYYSTESIVRPSTMYVMCKDEMLIAQDDMAIRIPSEMFEEIGALAADMADNKERGIIR